MAGKKKGFDFEQALAELERLVADMEAGGMPLEESLKAFEQGVRLTRECQQALLEAEQKVEVLLRKGEKGDQVELQPFTEGQDDCL